MTRAIKIENLRAIDQTSIQILRVISLKLGERDAAFVNYSTIAQSLNIDRDTVRKAVNRMIKHKILKQVNGKLSITDSILI